jgi:phage/plasmid primase-like uncharacterized protein
MMRNAALDDLVAEARLVRIEDELARRNIKLAGKKVERAGPCPVCGGDDRFSVNVRKQVWNCRGCGVGGDIVALVKHLEGCEFKAAVETLAGDCRPERPARAPPPAAPKTDDEEYERDQHRKAAWLWSQRRPIAGTIAKTYLRGRGIKCNLPASLGYLTARGDYPPAMIAAVALVDEPEPGLVGEPKNVDCVHLTRLLPDGSDRDRGEAAKITIGRPLGRPIVLAPVNDLLGIAVCEGIETGLSIYQVTGLGVWVAGTADRMPTLVDTIPAYVECVTIFADDDKAGRAGALALAEGLRARCRRGHPRFLRGEIEIIIEGLSK